MITVGAAIAKAAQIAVTTMPRPGRRGAGRGGAGRGVAGGAAWPPATVVLMVLTPPGERRTAVRESAPRGRLRPEAVRPPRRPLRCVADVPVGQGRELPAIPRG